MFCLAEFQDHVCLPPTEIGFGSRLGAVKKLLRRRCLNKVVQDAGVAVCLGDVLEVSHMMRENISGHGFSLTILSPKQSYL